MLTLDTNAMKSSIKELVIDGCVERVEKSNLENRCKNKGLVSTSLHYDGSKVISFHYREPSLIRKASIWIKIPKNWNNIFPSVVFTYPNQLYNRNYRFWPLTLTPNASTMFHVSGMKRVMHRHKGQKPCYDWKNYDPIIWKSVISDIGCRPFYDPDGNKMPNCSTKDEMQRIYEKIANYENPPPACIEMYKYDVSKVTISTSLSTENKWFPGMGKKLEHIDGWHRISVQFQGQFFKETRQTRAYSLQSLIGNAGGYIGLFIGVEAYDMPILLMSGYVKLHEIIFRRNH
jgi:hypothetical protein